MLTHRSMRSGHYAKDMITFYFGPELQFFFSFLLFDGELDFMIFTFSDFFDDDIVGSELIDQNMFDRKSFRS